MFFIFNFIEWFRLFTGTDQKRLVFQTNCYDVNVHKLQIPNFVKIHSVCGRPHGRTDGQTDRHHAKIVFSGYKMCDSWRYIKISTCELCYDYNNFFSYPWSVKINIILSVALQQTPCSTICKDCLSCPYLDVSLQIQTYEVEDMLDGCVKLMTTGVGLVIPRCCIFDLRVVDKRIDFVLSFFSSYSFSRQAVSSTVRILEKIHPVCLVAVSFMVWRILRI